jgi:membrane protein YdbS with pleckstrin-like domain
VTAFLLKLLVSAAFTVLVWASGQYTHHPVAWWLAAILAVLVVFVTMFIVDRRPGRRRWRG